MWIVKNDTRNLKGMVRSRIKYLATPNVQHVADIYENYDSKNPLPCARLLTKHDGISNGDIPDP